MLFKIVFLTLTVMGLGFLLFYPPLSLSRVEFEGRSYLSKQQLQTFVSPYLGQNIFKVVYLNRFKYRLAAAFPMLGGIDVTYGLPDELYVRIRSKKPLISLYREDQHYDLLAQDGTFLGQSESPAVGTVRLKGVSSVYLEGKGISPALRKEVLSIHHHVVRWLHQDSYVLEMMPDRTWQLYLTGSYPIFLGDSQHLLQKMRLLSAFFKQVPRPVKFLDIGLGNQLLVRYD